MSAPVLCEAETPAVFAACCRSTNPLQGFSNLPIMQEMQIKEFTAGDS